MPHSDLMSYVANIATIIALFFAVIVYFSWKRDYQQQQAHAYAIDLLKKIKILHLTIEQLRAPKFYNREKLIEEITNNYIPKIEEKILSKVLDIQCDLMMAKNILLTHKNLQQEFNLKIFDQIIKNITRDVHLFLLTKDDSNFKVEESGLFRTIFPAEVREPNKSTSSKKSILGINTDVIDDNFNKIIEKSFQSIYSMLQGNLIQSKQK